MPASSIPTSLLFPPLILPASRILPPTPLSQLDCPSAVPLPPPRLVYQPVAIAPTPPSCPQTMSGSSDPEREHALEEYKTKLLESREWEAKLKALRLEIKGLQHDFDVSEDNIKALQSVGQIIGEVLKQLDEERCKIPAQNYTGWKR